MNGVNDRNEKLFCERWILANHLILYNNQHSRNTMRRGGGKIGACSLILHDLFPKPTSLIVFSTSEGQAFQNSTSEFIAKSLYRSFTSPNRSTSNGRIDGATALSLDESCKAIRFISTTRHVNAVEARLGWFVDARPCLTESKTRDTASDSPLSHNSRERRGEYVNVISF